MNFNRLSYDDNTYLYNQKQSMGTGEYMLNTPLIDCQKCLSVDPSVASQYSGGSTCANRSLIDVSSELLNLSRKKSNCPAAQYLPSANGNAFCEQQLPQMDNCKQMIAEDTRISNPPCTLRGTGVNRWEWLCHDPQAKAVVPFEYNVSYRLIAKDNHRPCISKPIDVVQVLPQHHFSDDMYSSYVPCTTPINDIPSVHWQTCKTYANALH